MWGTEVIENLVTFPYPMILLLAYQLFAINLSQFSIYRALL